MVSPTPIKSFTQSSIDTFAQFVKSSENKIHRLYKPWIYSVSDSKPFSLETSTSWNPEFSRKLKLTWLSRRELDDQYQIESKPFLEWYDANHESIWSFDMGSTVSEIHEMSESLSELSKTVDIRKEDFFLISTMYELFRDCYRGMGFMHISNPDLRFRYLLSK